MNQIHPGRRSLFKYTTPKTALTILQNKTVRYSSPLTFNDPFDIQTGLHFDFKLDELAEKIVDHIGRFASASVPPPVDEEHPWGQMALIARRKFPTCGFDKAFWLNMIKPSFDTDIVPIITETQANFRKYWDNSLPAMRVFCVSEERDNLLMWAHYAENHTGAVFEFLSLPEKDNVLSIAQKVDYVSNPPTFFSEQEWLNDFISIKPLDTSLLHRRYVLQKSKDWHYEKEWRVWYPDSQQVGHHDYIPVANCELPAIYIGCRAESTFVTQLISQARMSFPNTRIFQAKRHTASYSLEYAEIK
ncbi:DUF2971 domain-containing protein [Pseudomonas sp. H9]|uniref:DUF2971 domain-containing protein n=1 Tax=Pseudomonas sp. H9 TaxID=483968 RepID=UPI0010577952|nr:DUF2971 domain-containing protein [Pseudomonas sp. H9]TDF86287.1 DUF2971 domain-containing protein [Pseudomonas sp. H9]